jgi:hypothetical protein
MGRGKSKLRLKRRPGETEAIFSSDSATLASSQPQGSAKNARRVAGWIAVEKRNFCALQIMSTQAYTDGWRMCQYFFAVDLIAVKDAIGKRLLPTRH